MFLWRRQSRGFLRELRFLASREALCLRGQRKGNLYPDETRNLKQAANSEDVMKVPSCPFICAPVIQVTERSAGVRDDDRHWLPGTPSWRRSKMTDLCEIKRDRPCNRRWLLRHGALALPFILVSIPARAVERVGSVEDVKGEAFAELDAVRRALDRAAPVFLGDEVVTGVAATYGYARVSTDGQSLSATSRAC
jgi:hypothetical protein